MLILSCTQNDKPRDFVANQHACEYCMMRISDMRFRAEVITQKGKAHFFDSVECLSAWTQDHPKENHSAWVGDFFDTKAWIKLSEAHILQSKKINSPMGAGLSAHKGELSFQRAWKEFKGRRLDSKGLELHVGKWRQQLRQK